MADPERKELRYDTLENIETGMSMVQKWAEEPTSDLLGLNVLRHFAQSLVTLAREVRQLRDRSK